MPILTFQFHYFAVRKLHFAMRANALVVFPGGFGTLDELFELLTLVQTCKMRRIPIVLVDEHYWSRLINFDVLAQEGMVAPGDLELFSYADDAEAQDEAEWMAQFAATPPSAFDALVEEGLADYHSDRTDEFDPTVEDD